MDDGTSPAPGWYINERNQPQWWDGARWGAVAHQAVESVGFQNSEPIPRERFLFDGSQPKKLGEAIAFLILMGTIGAHHFYLGNTRRAVLLVCLTVINVAIAAFVPALAIANWVISGAVILILVVDLFLLKKDTARSNARQGLDSGLLLPSELSRS